MKKLLLLIIIFSFVFAHSQENSNYLIKAGKLFDSESGKFKPDMVILVHGKIIREVKELRMLTDDDRKTYNKIIDLSTYAVMPGLIDAHTHLLNREVIHPGNDLAGLDMEKVLTMEGDAYRAIYGSVRAKAYLERGITAVQDLGNSGSFADIALKKAINEGLVPGPRMRCAGQGLSTEGGQLPGLIYKHRELASDEYRIIKGPDDAVQAVRENINQGADVIKIYANNTPNNTMLSIDEIRAIVKEAHRYGVRVTAHATSNTAAYNAIIGGVDGIEHGYQLFDSTLELMSKKGVVLVPTYGDSLVLAQYLKISFGNDKEKQNDIPKIVKGYLQYKDANIKNAIRKKVMIVAGSDDYVDFQLPFGDPSLHNLMGYVSSGMKIEEALQTATINASKQLNWEGKIGVIKPGAFADIVAFDNTLDHDINALLKCRFVMKDGKIYVGEVSF